jgi:hypothetical protein
MKKHAEDYSIPDFSEKSGYPRKHMKKKSNFKKITLGIVTLSITTLIGCSNQGEEPKKSMAKESEKTSVHTSSTETNAPKEIAKDTKKVGTPEYGYVNVPTDWANFIDVDGTTSFQVSKVDQSEIISLNIFEGPEEAKLEDFANSVAINMEGNGGKDIKAAKVKIKDQDALQVYGSYDNGTYFVVAWVFETEDGKVHYIAAEGTKDTILEAVGYIEKGGWSAN